MSARLWIAALVLAGLIVAAIATLACAAPLAAQLPAGLTSWTDLEEWCEAARPFTTTNVGAAPDRVLLVLQRADRCGISLTVTYPRRIQTTNGEQRGPYSPAKHRAASDAYARALPPDTIRKYMGRRVLLGIITGDDFGCAPCWGGEKIPVTEARDAANYAKRKLPDAAVGIRLDALKMQAGAPSGWVIDFGYAQWIASRANLRAFGTSERWYQLNAAAAAALGIRMVYGINTTHCTGGSSPTCTAAQVREYATAAARRPQSCVFLNWWWEPAEWSGAYRLEWERLFRIARRQPFTSCKSR